MSEIRKAIDNFIHNLQEQSLDEYPVVRLELSKGAFDRFAYEVSKETGAGWLIDADEVKYMGIRISRCH